jgi:acetyl-CoA C-acetyltransferase
MCSARACRRTPAYDIQQACGTGLEAALLVANKIALGQIDCGIAGGVDTTSDAPIGVSEGLRKILCRPTAPRPPATS